jgi:cytochrome c oxidase cbb3-type subunit 3
VDADAVLRIVTRSIGCLVVLAVMAAPLPSAAQSASDIQEGKALFAGLCSTCHGFEGTGGAGPPLNRAKLLNAPDDAALRNIISEGIPNRGMPRVRRTLESELGQLVAYVRSLGRTARTPIPGSASKGLEVYGRLKCASCHIVNGQGGSLGPVLSDIGWLRGAQYLRQAVVEPAATLPRGTLPVPVGGYNEYLPVRVVMRDGNEVRGLRLNEDLFTIQLRDVSGTFHSIRKSDTELVKKEIGASLMPSVAGRVSAGELDDLVAYLASLGGTK